MVKKKKGPSKKVLEYRIKLARRGPSDMMAEAVAELSKEFNLYFAWSGGRCSTCALHMTLEYSPDIPVVFTNTGVEYPETVKYCRSIAKEWGFNYHELKPEHNFWDIVKKHGFPQLRGSSKKKRPRRPLCCKLLKEDPGNKFLKENGHIGLITGIRVEESRARALGIYQKGQFYYTIRDRIWKFHPVSLWSMSEMNEYIELNGIELNPLYAEGYERVGCLPCTGFSQWREQLSKHRPRFYKWLNREYQKSQGEPTMWEYFEPQDCRQDPDL